MLKKNFRGGIVGHPLSLSSDPACLLESLRRFSSSSSTCFEDPYHCKLRSKSDNQDDDDESHDHHQQDYLGKPPPLGWFALKPWALWGISSLRIVK